MSFGCTSSCSALGCVDARAPVRATYVNLYKWPESDAEFVRSVSAGRRTAGEHRGRPRQYLQPRVVDSYSCRQMFLRSYTFSKKESVPERTKKCLGKVKDKVAAAVNVKKVTVCGPWSGVGGGDGNGNLSVPAVDGDGRGRSGKRCPVFEKVREVSSSIFHRLLFRTASVDVADRQPW